MSKMKNPKKAKAKNTLEFRIVIGVVAISIILNILAMALTGGASTYVMGIIAIAIGAIVIALQTELEDTDSKLEVSKLLKIVVAEEAGQSLISKPSPSTSHKIRAKCFASSTQSAAKRK